MHKITLRLGIRAKCGAYIHITTHLVRFACSHMATCIIGTESYAHSHSTDTGTVPWVGVIYISSCPDPSLS